MRLVGAAQIIKWTCILWVALIRIGQGIGASLRLRPKANGAACGRASWGRMMASERKSHSADKSVQSVERAAVILQSFTPERPELTLTEVHSVVGFGKSTTHRLLSTLEGLDLVAYDPATRRYRLGLHVFQLGSVAAKSMELVKRADPLLMNLAQESGDTTFLAVSDGDQALCLRRFDGDHNVRVLFLEAGKRSPFNCGSAQRVLLAHMPEPRWEEIVTSHTQHMTGYSLTKRDELDRDRREIRERGYALSWEDVTLHACALGAPVRDVSGEVIASVSISGIIQRFSGDRMPILIPAIMELGNELSRLLGYVSPS
jgi:IclR family KDG regulon transcriptional repressor